MRRYSEEEKERVLDSALDRLATIFELPPRQAWAVGIESIEDCVWASPFHEMTYGYSFQMESALAQLVRKLGDPGISVEAIFEATAKYSACLKTFRPTCDRNRFVEGSSPRLPVNEKASCAA